MPITTGSFPKALVGGGKAKMSKPPTPMGTKLGSMFAKNMKKGKSRGRG